MEETIDTPKLSVQDFAAKIKAKYPEYKDIPDNELANKVIAKHPEYESQVDLKKNTNSESTSTAPATNTENIAPAPSPESQNGQSTILNPIERAQQSIERRRQLLEQGYSDIVQKEPVYQNPVNQDNLKGKLYGISGIVKNIADYSIENLKNIYSAGKEALSTPTPETAGQFVLNSMRQEKEGKKNIIGAYGSSLQGSVEATKQSAKNLAISLVSNPPMTSGEQAKSLLSATKLGSDAAITGALATPEGEAFIGSLEALKAAGVPDETVRTAMSAASTVGNKMGVLNENSPTYIKDLFGMLDLGIMGGVMYYSPKTLGFLKDKVPFPEMPKDVQDNITESLPKVKPNDVQAAITHPDNIDLAKKEKEILDTHNDLQKVSDEAKPAISSKLNQLEGEKQQIEKQEVDNQLTQAHEQTVNDIKNNLEQQAQREDISEPSKEAIKTMADNLKSKPEIKDFTDPKTAYDKAQEEGVQITDPSEYDRYVAEHSESPLELAQHYLNIGEYKTQKSYLQEAIEGLGIKIKPSDFEHYGDPNLISPLIAKKWFDKNAPPLDTQAQELSEVAGFEVSPQAIIDHVLATEKAEPSKYASLRRDFKNKFHDLTGQDLTPKLAKQIIKEHEKTGRIRIPVTKISEGINGEIPQGTGREAETAPAEPTTQSTGEEVVPRETNISPTDVFHTMDMGELTGKEENTKTKKQFTDAFKAGDEKVGKTGESADDFKQRTIPEFQNILSSEPNAVIVTHSSDLKLFKTWNEVGRPDVSRIVKGGDLADEFNKNYLKQSTQNGDVETFKGDKGNVYVVRHGETEDNLHSNFRRPETQLTDKGRDEAKQAGELLKAYTGGDKPKIITSDFPRTIETSKIINDQFGEPSNKPNTVGISHDALNKLANKLGLPEVARGKVLTPKEYADMGRAMLKQGVDPNSILTSGLEPHQMASVARAYLEELKNKADAIKDKTSQEYKDISKKIEDYEANVVKPIGTKFAELGRSLQGERDLVTDNFMEAEKSLKQQLGVSELTKEQTEKLQKLTEENKSLKNKVSELEKKETDAIDKDLGDKNYVDNANKVVTETRRQRRIKEVDKFFDDAIKSISQKGVAYATIIPPEVIKVALKGMKEAYHAGEEIGKIIEDAVKYISSKIKKDWDKEKFTKEYTDKLSKLTKESDEQKAIARKEKQLEDFKAGVEKKRTAKEYNFTPEEKAKFDALNAELKNLKLSKLTKVLQDEFSTKKGNMFSTQEAKGLWNYMKEKYMSNGVEYEDAIKYTANDMGLTADQVRSAILTPKAKPISIEKWKQRSSLSKSRDATQRYMDEQASSFALRQFKKLSGDIRDIATFGHGHVFLGTHAGLTAFSNPVLWTQAYIKGIKLAYSMSDADVAKFSHDFENRPLYDVFNKAGLQNDIHKTGTDMEIASQSHLLDLSRKIHGKGGAIGKVGQVLVGGSEAGRKGFIALKWLRQMLAEQAYDNLTEEEKSNPKVLESIAHLMNNATGATNVKMTGGLNEVLKEATFAGGMEISRWEKLFRNPPKAMATLAKMPFEKIGWIKDLPPEERVFATLWAKRVLTQAVVYGGLVAISKAIFQPDDKTLRQHLMISIGKDTELDPTSGMLSLTNFLGKLWRDKSNVSDAGKDILKYGRGKLAPSYQIGADVVLSHDVMGNVTPIRLDKGAKPENKYSHVLSPAEYTEEKLPIPVAEGFAAYNESHNQAAALTSLAIAGGLGMKEFVNKPSEASRRTSRPDASRTQKRGRN